MVLLAPDNCCQRQLLNQQWSSHLPQTDSSCWRLSSRLPLRPHHSPRRALQRPLILHHLGAVKTSQRSLILLVPLQVLHLRRLAVLPRQLKLLVLTRTRTTIHKLRTYPAIDSPLSLGTTSSLTFPVTSSQWRQSPLQAMRLPRLLQVHTRRSQGATSLAAQAPASPLTT